MGFELPNLKNLESQIFNLSNEQDGGEIALKVFRYQFLTNSIYQQYCQAIGRPPEQVNEVHQIPFLPIRFFKSHQVVSGEFEPQIIFTSSGTTGDVTSRHYVKDLKLYEESFLRGFELVYGPTEEYCILGLLPSYLEREGSSLIFMVEQLIRKSGHPQSGFYLYDHDKLAHTLQTLGAKAQKTILFGVSYALLNFAEAFPMALQNVTVIETGGMKGKKKEVAKSELYYQLQQAFSMTEIHSEYGMTELLSQAYAVNGLYQTPPWMKILLREETDPFSFAERTGVINVIDLANLYSCSFIATDDLGRMHADGTFEVLGRVDNSDIRGCSQLVL
jgi:hypothetical protein